MKFLEFLLKFWVLVMSVLWRQGSSASIVIRLQAGWLRNLVWYLAASDFSLLQSIHINSEALVTFCSMGTGGCFPGAKLTTHFHLVMGLRMHEDVVLLPICLHGIVLN
jgi:hypothetical protein